MIIDLLPRRLVVLLAAMVLLASACGDDSSTEPAADLDPDPAPATVDDDGPICPAEDHSSPRTLEFSGPQPTCIDPAQPHVAVFDTTEGEIRVVLDTVATPITTNNFVTLARWGYYDDTTMFRTDPSIDIIQGGAPTTESPADPGPGYTIPDEPVFDDVGGQLVGPYRYEPGQLVMARARGRDSAGAQYFFSTGVNTALLDSQGVYVVFGETDADGLAVLQSIMALHEPGGPFGGAPSRTVTVNSVRIELG